MEFWGDLQYLWIINIDKNGNKIWDKSYGTEISNDLSCVINTKDRGFLIGVSTQGGSYGDKSDTSFGSSDLWIIKLDSLGNKVWDMSYGGEGIDLLRDIVETHNGYFLLGKSYSDVSGNKTSINNGIGLDDYWLVKIDVNGNKVWDKSYGGSSSDYGIKILKIHNNKYILCGNSTSNTSGDKSMNKYGTSGYDFWLIAIDSNGNKIWDKIYGSSCNEQLKDAQYKNGRIVLTGAQSGDCVDFDKTEAHISRSGFDFWTIVVDSNGNKIWDKTIGCDTGIDRYEVDIDVSSNNEILLSSSISGATQGFDLSENSRGDYDVWVVKLDSNGNKVWDKIIGTPLADLYQNVLFTDSGNVLVACFTVFVEKNIDKTVRSYDDNDIWLVNLREPANIITGRCKYPLFPTGCKVIKLCTSF